MKKNKRKTYSVFWRGFVILCMFLVVGCSTQTTGPAEQQEGAESKTGGTITVAYPFEPDTLDAHMSVASAGVYTWLLGGSLLYKDPATNEYKPSLASDYKISDDGKTWTFTIRSGITFHDGTALTAKSFKETVDRALNPQTKAKTAAELMAPIKSVKAPDDQTLVLELQEPYAAFRDALGNYLTQPLSLKAIEKAGESYGRNPVGVGPWKLESWKTGEGVTYVRNEAFQWGEPYYENLGPPRANKLIIKAIADSQLRMSALESGAIDVATEVPVKDANRYRNNPKYQVLEYLRPGVGLMLEMNLTRPEFQDIQVRKAIHMLVNKEAIVQAVTKGEGEVAHTPLSPSTLGYDKSLEKYGYQYHVNEAKKLLDEAGWKVNGSGVREKDGKTFSLNLLSTADLDKEAQLLQAMLGEAGINMKIQNLEIAGYMQEVVKGNFDVTLISGAYDDPDILYFYFHSSGAYNLSGVQDDKLDALLLKGRTTMQTDARKQVYMDVQKHLIEQAYVVPIYYDKAFTVINSRVKGVKWTSVMPTYNDSWIEN
ncbi:ABC transporter substrate-binding protein [Brevibacillus porteri]|uniref:ABC transporter substrate-binding protein n=1 Tax=Brevibacillus porteri TaxID=2126350 RepID=A0ABX5FRX1_9BACL|nr:ABC transporter substrate-binding protein [Brevibacillus porteri]MED1801212.1 ABC transporter substrate-binding protein [Brevibacillus porteri]MED2134588.1 ABC transporter substrate-binding protein [Brevibacillus porteri]MED2744881.1 ABC transporter substrate-binding protein [Brevibacillus porteri]MED2813089.1 ABC transporter substrate-binding protein [Brevibacillus porteri]MED2896106.1 ABC transporter substrate-binding protein [Brevibacillus porteri]